MSRLHIADSIGVGKQRQIAHRTDDQLKRLHPVSLDLSFVRYKYNKLLVSGVVGRAFVCDASKSFAFFQNTASTSERLPKL